MASSTNKVTGGLILLTIAMAGSRPSIAQLTPAQDLTGTWVGSGTADASYPDATRAEGTCQLSYTSPIGPAGGTGRWTARRTR